ncbi:hypothetical protein LSTR_LSTR014716 [Laodelphax striatellus]|uniref:Uncharacterized protein n=1 Tax=Laodelphax striatellus TaxID=195883 RepID=A0A482WMS3_LAOST|nr:hypothetical protein LSTR_LSTR014716 [Laodelphax striatellus]
MSGTRRRKRILYTRQDWSKDNNNVIVKSENFDEKEDVNADITYNIKDEIEINESSAQFVKNEFCCCIPVGSVKQEADCGNVCFNADDIKHDIDKMSVSSFEEEFFKGFDVDPLSMKVECGNDDSGYADFNAEDMKTDIDIDETPISLIKKEFLDGFSPHPFLLKKEPEEPCSSVESQFHLGYEFKLYTCRSQRDARSLMKSLRKFRSRKSEAKLDARIVKQGPTSDNAETNETSSIP